MLNANVQTALQFCPSLATPPGIAMQIVELARQPEVSLTRVVDLLAQDPALTARVMRASNSAFFARHRQADNLRQAVVVIGLNATMNLALGFSLGHAMDEGLGSPQALNLGWRRVLIASCAARLIGNSLRRRDTEELALAALLQDLGILALSAAMPEDYGPLISRAANHDDLLRAERAALQTDHGEVGSWLMKQWQLPSRLASITEQVHGGRAETVAEVDAGAVDIVAFCGALADRFLGSDDVRSAANGLPDWGGIPGLDQVQLDAVLDELSDRLPEMGELFGIEILSESLLNGIIDEARAALADRAVMQAQLANQAPEFDIASADADAENGWSDHFAGSGRAALEETLLREFRASTDQGWPLSLAFVTLASHSQLIEAYGVERLNELMLALRQKMVTLVRSEDRVFDYGGYELAVFFPKLSELLSSILLKRLRQEFQSEFKLGANQSGAVIDLRFGLATHMDQGFFFNQPIELLAAADEALREQL